MRNSDRAAHLAVHRDRAEFGHFFVITLPAGEITYHEPPLRLIACPACQPALVSVTYVYSGHQHRWPRCHRWGRDRCPTSEAFTAPEGVALAPAESFTGGQTAAQLLTQVTFLSLSGANVYSAWP